MTDGKLVSYWRVHTGEDGKPVWQQLDGAPVTLVDLVGDTTVENDDQVMRVYFADGVARGLVTRAVRDAAALGREHGLPHQPTPQP